MLDHAAPSAATGVERTLCFRRFWLDVWVLTPSPLALTNLIVAAMGHNVHELRAGIGFEPVDGDGVGDGAAGGGVVASSGVAVRAAAFAGSW